MSAGAFVLSFYEDENANIHSIRVQPETLLLSIAGTENTPPTGPADPGFASAQVSKGRNSIGYNARLVSIKFPTNPPDGYKADQIIRLPWLRETTFGAIQAGQTVTYLGATGVVAGKTPEKIR